MRVAHVHFGDEGPGKLVEPRRVFKETIVADGPQKVGLLTVGVELALPLGGYTMYGMLGATFGPSEDGAGLNLVVPLVETGAVFKGGLVPENEKAFVELPEEVATVVIAKARSHIAISGFSSGMLHFDRAIFGQIGSSAVLFGILTEICLDLLKMTHQPDEGEIRELLQATVARGFDS